MHCVPNMLQVFNAARNTQLRVFYAMHRRYRLNDYESWKYIAPIQKAGLQSRASEYGRHVGRRDSQRIQAAARGLSPTSIAVPALSMNCLVKSQAPRSGDSSSQFPVGKRRMTSPSFECPMKCTWL